MGKKSSNDITEWYKVIPKHMIPKYENPSFEDHLITIPARIIIVGASGSGKTQLALEMIKRFKNTFGHITLCTQNASEPLYDYLKSKLLAEQLSIFEGVENIPDLSTLDPYEQHLIIFDDLCLERRQDIIQQYFIRSRKIAKGCTLLYLTQSYYATPKNVRLNSTHVVLKKLSTSRDLKFILGDFNLGLEPEEMLDMYKYCVDDGGFMMVAVQDDPDKRYRKNFLENITPKENIA
jgi:hypothetical protein